MTRRVRDVSNVLRWYPPAWRTRYGDELVDLISDTVEGRRLSLTMRLSLAWAGLRERGHESGLVGDQESPTGQARAGSLLVLCSWTAFVLAGASFSKLSEHFAQSMPPGSRMAAHIGFDMVATFGVLGMLFVAIGAGVALRSVVTYLRTGGWSPVRRATLQAMVLTVITAGAIAPLSLWAHGLTSLQRNGSSGAYSFAITVWAIFIALTLASWSRAAVKCVRHMELPRRVLQIEAGLAVAVVFIMIVITAGAAIWWGDVASHAPWFLQGTNYGSSASPLTANLIVTLALMLGGSVGGLFGVSRIARVWRNV